MVIPKVDGGHEDISALCEITCSKTPADMKRNLHRLPWLGRIVSGKGVYCYLLRGATGVTVAIGARDTCENGSVYRRRLYLYLCNQSLETAEGSSIRTSDGLDLG